MSLAQILTGNRVNNITNKRDTSITACRGQRYNLSGLTGCSVKIDDGCTGLRLYNCNYVDIVCGRLPICGITVENCQNVNIVVSNAGSASASAGSSYLDYISSSNSTLQTAQECIIEISDCCNIVANSVNISDLYHSSTWSMSHQEE